MRKTIQYQLEQAEDHIRGLNDWLSIPNAKIFGIGREKIQGN
jgi:hypothetical protein